MSKAISPFHRLDQALTKRLGDTTQAPRLVFARLPKEAFNPPQSTLHVLRGRPLEVSDVKIDSSRN